MLVCHMDNTQGAQQEDTSMMAYGYFVVSSRLGVVIACSAINPGRRGGECCKPSYDLNDIYDQSPLAMYIVCTYVASSVLYALLF